MLCDMVGVFLPLYTQHFQKSKCLFVTGWIHWYDCDGTKVIRTNAVITAWSSGRDPSDVFKLLEHVHLVFDEAANR